MPRFKGLSGTQGREQLDPPMITPSDMDTEDPVQLGPDGVRSSSVQYYPVTQDRVLVANRQTGIFVPHAAYAEGDAQKGGVPGGTDYAPSLPVDSQNQQAGLVEKEVPTSPFHLTYGDADWSDTIPTFVGAHVKIVWAQNPNRPQVNATPFTYEYQPAGNTNYVVPSPWAYGTFIG